MWHNYASKINSEGSSLGTPRAPHATCLFLPLSPPPLYHQHHHSRQHHHLGVQEQPLWGQEGQLVMGVQQRFSLRASYITTAPQRAEMINDYCGCNLYFYHGDIHCKNYQRTSNFLYLFKLYNLIKDFSMMKTKAVQGRMGYKRLLP